MQRMFSTVVMAIALFMITGCKSRQERAGIDAARAQAYLDAGDLTRAAKAIRDAVKLQDDQSDYWLLQGRIALARKDYKGAYAGYTRAWELDSANPETVQVLAEFSYSSNRLDDAEKYANQLSILAPGNVQAQILKAQVALKRNNLDAAKAVIDPIFERYPNNDNIAMVKARWLSMSGSYKEAAALIEPIAQKKPSPLLELAFLTQVYRKLGDADAISRTYQRMAKLRSDDVDVQIGYARALLDIKRLDDALGVIDHLLSIHSESATLDRIREMMLDSNFGPVSIDKIMQPGGRVNAMTRVAFAGYLIEMNRPDLAQKLLEADLANARPAIVIAYAGAEAAQGKADSALYRLAPILEKDATNPDALMVRARIECDRGQLNSAESDVHVVVRDNPNMARARVLLAQIYLAKTQAVLADDIYQTSVNDLPDSARVVLHYASYLLASHRSATAVDVVTAFAKRSPNLRRAWRIQAGTCVKAGDKVCAAEAATQVQRLSSHIAISDVPNNE